MKKGKPVFRFKISMAVLLQWLQWLPVYAVLLVLPLVKHYKLYASRLTGYPFFTDETINHDFDLYYKHTVFLYITGAVFLLLCYLLLKNKKEIFENLKRGKQWLILVPLGVYLLFAFLSSVCSDYRYAAFTGSDTQFESFFALAGYVLLPCYLFFLIRSERDMKYAGIALGISMAEMAVLGLLQYTGNSLLNFEWYQKLITPDGYLEAIGPVTNTLGENSVVLAAHNPNYAGVLLAVLSALCLGVLLTERHIGRMAGELVLLVGLVMCLLGTQSDAAFLIFAAAAAIAAVFVFRRFLKYWYVLIPALTFVVLLASLSIQYYDLSVLDSLKRTLAVEKRENPIQRMVTTESGVEITYKDVPFKVRMSVYNEQFNILVLDEKGSRIPLILSEDGTYYHIDHEVLSGITVAPGLLDKNTPLLIITMEGRKWTFLTEAKWTEEYLYMNPYGQPDTMDETKRFGFREYGDFASSRGFIWSQTLPLLPARFLLGEGANCFIFAYPQNNYKDIFFYSGSMLVVSRPHCLYLQMGVETGVVSLIAMLVFWGWYLLQSVPLYFKSRFGTWTERIGFGCFLAVTAYLGCGLTNDSMITVTPVFWCILGIGLAANQLVKKQRAEAQTVRAEMAEAEALIEKG